MNARTIAAKLVGELEEAWARGDGAAFARPFSADARFIAFDGSVLNGPDEIGAFHQKAFSSHLAGTRLHVRVEDAREIAPGIVAVLSRGGIDRDGEGAGALIGASIQTLLISQTEKTPRIVWFQNTRERPIKGPEEAKVWREFDDAWNRLSGKSPF